MITGTYNLQSVIVNFAPVELFISTTGGSASSLASLVAFEVNTQVLDYFKSKEISQFIKGICNDLTNLLRYFNGIAILTSSNFSVSSAKLPVKLVF